MKQKTKKCSKCKKDKPLDEFNNSRSGTLGRHHYCRICYKEHRKGTYNSERARVMGIRYKYGLSPLDLNNMYTNQKGCCAICGDYKEEVSKHGGLVVDHSHITGNVRKLLCNRCNVLIGGESIELMEKAILYLKEHQ